MNRLSQSHDKCRTMQEEDDDDEESEAEDDTQGAIVDPK
jgi:hypothetical protein